MGQMVRKWLPTPIQKKVVAKQSKGQLPATTAHHPRHVLMLNGCVQPGMMHNIDAATIRVLDKVGIGSQVLAQSGCCGALNFHLDAQEQARFQMRTNIDAWWPLIDSGVVEAIVMNASGCLGTVK